PSLQVVRELARLLGVSENWLATGAPVRPESSPLLMEAEVSLRLDDLDEAGRLFTRVRDDARSDWERAEALQGLGEIALRSGHLREAVGLLEEALDLHAVEPHEQPQTADALARAYG